NPNMASTRVPRSSALNCREGRCSRSWVNSSCTADMAACAVRTKTKRVNDRSALPNSYRVLLMLGLIAAILGAVGASAQTYPIRPIRMLVGFTPAGPTDLTARLAAQYLSEA